MQYLIVNVEDIRNRLANIFTRIGVVSEDADLLVDTFLDAEIIGRESHGIMRVPDLYNRILNGTINIKPNITFSNITDCIYAVDGDNALGAVLADRTMKFCEKVAAEKGIAVAAVKNANHLGAAGYYTTEAAKNGYFAFLACNAGPGAAPYGGMSRLLGTSPFSVSFPAGKYDNFMLDIATSAAAYGKVAMYAKKGEKLPLGWAMDENGNDTTDAQVAINAFKKGVGLLPMGAHKGMGISMIIDVLAGLLTGAKFSYEVSNSFSTSSVSGVGFFYIVLDIQRFIPMHQFITSIENWFDLLKADKLRLGASGIFIPGEIENMKRRAVGKTIKVFDGTMQEIEKIEMALDK